MQIYRKLWHVSFIWAPIVYFFWLDSRQAIIISLIFLSIFFVFDLIRLNWNRGNEIVYRYFSWLLREEEKKGLNTAIYFALSCIICSVFFEKRVAVLAVTLLCVGDPIAAIIGTKYGSIRILNKSLQGSLACFVVCLLTSLILFDPIIAFWAALTATFFELISSRLNDNLSIPIFSGLMVTLLLESPQLTGPMQYLLIFIKVYIIFVITTSLTGIGIKHYIMHYYTRQYASSFKPVNPSLPLVSIIKPVCGLEGRDYNNFVSFCRQDYSGGWELIFVVEDYDDPAVQIINRLKIYFPHRKIDLVIAEKNHTTTDKMNKLICGVKHASGEILVFSDAAVRVESDFLRILSAPLFDPRIGLVTSVAAYRWAKNLPAALNCHLVNLLGQSLHYALAFFERLESANGCAIGIRREVFDEAGGFEAISDQVSESHALAQAVVKKGYRIHLLNKMLMVCHRSLSFAEWLNRTHRMAVIYYTHVRHRYPLFLFQLGFVHALLYWLLFPQSIVGPVLATVTILAEIISHLRMNYLYIKDRSTYLFIWLLPVLLIIAPILWARPYLNQVIEWRGVRYFVDQDGVATRLKRT